mmetsp:Transcript_20450/g.29918  ORF Transcript_20450/g.29918 Transcript_20450/m.29918 type:complete len:246 (-) Transcript_20450:73-810(-)
MATSADGSEVVVPVSYLNNIEIRLGGVVYASSDGEVFCIMDESDWDGEMRKEVNCHYSSDKNNLWLPYRIRQWPQSHWSTIQEMEYAGRTTGERFDAHDALLEQVAVAFPDATVSFPLATFFSSGVQELIKKLEIPSISEEEKQEDEDVMRLFNVVSMMLRSRGNNENGEAFANSVYEIVSAVRLLGLNISGEEFATEVLTLVNAQMESLQSGVDFISQVRETHNIQAPDNDESGRHEQNGGESA